MTTIKDVIYDFGIECIDATATEYGHDYKDEIREKVSNLLGDKVFTVHLIDIIRDAVKEGIFIGKTNEDMTVKQEEDKLNEAVKDIELGALAKLTGY